MITSEAISVKKVEAELAEIETTYRAKKKALRALLAVLKLEDGKDENNDVK